MAVAVTTGVVLDTSTGLAKRLNEEVSRNLERFPDDFMFRLTADEFSIFHR